MSDLKILEPSDIQHRLRQLVYGPRRAPVEEIARLIDCDIQTANLALRGIMTRTTQTRFSRVMTQKFIPRVLPENRDLNSNGVRDTLIRKIDGQSRMIYAIFAKQSTSTNSILTWPKRKLLALYIENDYRLKRYFLQQHEKNKAKKFFLWDNMSFRQWREALQIHEFNRLGRSQL